MRKSSCVFVLNEKGKVLVIARKDNNKMFGLPGGELEEDKDSSFLECASRELFEETGIDLTVNLNKFIPLYVGEVNNYWCATYLVHIKKGDHLISTEEGLDYKWVSLDELVKIPPFSAYNKKVVEQYKSFALCSVINYIGK